MLKRELKTEIQSISSKSSSQRSQVSTKHNFEASVPLTRFPQTCPKSFPEVFFRSSPHLSLNQMAFHTFSFFLSVQIFRFGNTNHYNTLAIKRYMGCCILDDIVLKLDPSCLKTAVSIETGFPTRSYKEKYVINNRSTQRELLNTQSNAKKKKERDVEREPRSDIPQCKNKCCRNTADSDWGNKLNFQIPNQ